jgi:hypothetical protein
MALAFQILLIAAVLLVIVAALAARRQSIRRVARAGYAAIICVFLTVWLQGALLIASGVLAGAMLGWALARGIGVWASARTGLAIDAVPGAAEAWLLFALARRWFAARGAAIAHRAAGLRQPLASARLSNSDASSSSGNDLSTAWSRGSAAHRSDR